MIAQSWLVLELTHSSVALGLIVAVQTLPVLLLGPYGGLVADRVDKRRLMIGLQSLMALQALVLGLLTLTGAIQVWEIGVLAALLGLNNAFENPARQAFMLELVGPEQLRNAVSLNSVLVNVARAIGPARRRHPDRDDGRGDLLPGQRRQLRRRRRRARDDGAQRAPPEPPGRAGTRTAARRACATSATTRCSRRRS